MFILFHFPFKLDFHKFNDLFIYIFYFFFIFYVFFHTDSDWVGMSFITAYMKTKDQKKKKKILNKYNTRVYKKIDVLFNNADM